MLRTGLLILLLLGLVPAQSWAETSHVKPQPAVSIKSTAVKSQSAKVSTATAKSKHVQSNRTKTNRNKFKQSKHEAVRSKHVTSKKTSKKNKHIKSQRSKKNQHAKSRNTQSASIADDDDDEDDDESLDEAATTKFNTAEASTVKTRTQKLLGYATNFLGAHYHFGGYSPATGFDCSGYVSYVFKHAAGISLPHNAAAISHVGTKVRRDQLRPGDLVFFRYLRRPIGHVGIYMGNDRFIHAGSSTTGVVQVSSLNEGYWIRHFQGARRLMVANANNSATFGDTIN